MRATARACAGHEHATLADVARSLTAALDLANERAGEELVAQQLRRAATGLGELTGRVDAEEFSMRYFANSAWGNSRNALRLNSRC
jgi:tRNA U34 5-carboxymethylaminomethyl modifying GTPase MnmE/TrmE